MNFPTYNKNFKYWNENYLLKSKLFQNIIRVKAILWSKIAAESVYHPMSLTARS